MSIQENKPIEPLDPADFIYLEMAHGWINKDESPGFMRNHYGTREMVQPYREKYKNNGLYRSAYLYDNLDPYNSNLFANFFMDFDSEDDLEKAREDLLFVIWKLHLESGFGLPMEAFRIYFSGKKGFHLLIPWVYMNIRPHAKLDRIFKWIAEDLNDQSVNRTIDLVIYEKRRLYRLENSIHQDTGLYKIPLQYNEAAHFTIEQIQELAKNNRHIQYNQPFVVESAARSYQEYIEEFEAFEAEKQKRFKGKNPAAAKIPRDQVPDFVQELIDEGPVKGMRNETAAALTSFWSRQELDKEEIWENLVDWNQGSLPERELETTMNSILNKGLTYGFSRLKALAKGEVEFDSYARDKYKRKGEK